jgi:hypothetical protein
VTTPGNNPSPEASGTTAVTNPDHATPRSTTPPVVAKPSAAGQGAEDLTWPALGALVACAAAFCLGAWLKGHRRTGDDGGDQRRIESKQGLLSEAVEGERSAVGVHSEDSHPAAHLPRGGGRPTPRGSTARRITDGRKHPVARRVPHQVGHQGVGARACSGDDLNPDPPA